MEKKLRVKNSTKERRGVSTVNLSVEITCWNDQREQKEGKDKKRTGQKRGQPNE